MRSFWEAADAECVQQTSFLQECLWALWSLLEAILAAPFPACVHQERLELLEGQGPGRRWLPGQIPAALWRTNSEFVSFLLIVFRQFSIIFCIFLAVHFLSFLFPFLHHFLLTLQDYALHKKCRGRTTRYFCFELFPIHQLEKLEGFLITLTMRNKVSFVFFCHASLNNFKIVIF